MYSVYSVYRQITTAGYLAWVLQRGIWLGTVITVVYIYTAITVVFLQVIVHVRVLPRDPQPSMSAIESVLFRDIGHELLDLHDYPIHWPLELAVSPVGTVVLESVACVYLPRCSA